jgi:exodeoxyribonuclease VII large subunit
MALQALNARTEVDVILIVRGGGSIEDLWAFNDERVVRAIAASRLPVVSGVGHETDFTLADFAADCRAPTPSAAAELSTPEIGDLQSTLRREQMQLVRTMSQQLGTRRDRLGSLIWTLRHLSPVSRVSNARQRVDDLVMRLDAQAQHRLEMGNQRMEALAARLASLSPDAVLARGYVIVRETETGRVLTSVQATTVGLAATLQFHDGSAAVRVEGTADVDI